MGRYHTISSGLSVTGDVTKINLLQDMKSPRSENAMFSREFQFKNKDSGSAMVANNSVNKNRSAQCVKFT